VDGRNQGRQREAAIRRVELKSAGAGEASRPRFRIRKLIEFGCRVLIFSECIGRRSVVDVAWQEAGVSVQDVAERAKVLNRLRIGDIVFHRITKTAAVFVLVVLGGVIVSLFLGALPALQEFGFGFLTTQSWNPVTEKFGALAPIYGTIITSLIAMLIAVPFGLMIAMFLTELCPIWLRRPIGIAIELLAGIPSIIYGIWGLFVFAPFLQQYVQPPVIAAFENVPVLSILFAGPPFGIGILTASLILAIMVLPFITSISRDVFDAVPPVLKEAAYGLGWTQWEVWRYVVLPFTRIGVIGGVMLGLGRALGETMAVTFVIGNAHKISGSLLAPGTTISATIANEFTEAVGDLYTSSLIALGLILFIITFMVLAVARYLLLRIERRIG
jgi:phosphate transport system permease protein